MKFVETCFLFCQTKKVGYGNKERIDIGTGRGDGSFLMIIVSITSSIRPTKNQEVIISRVSKPGNCCCAYYGDICTIPHADD